MNVVPRVRRAARTDLDAVVRVLVESHLTYAWESWALPWPDRRARLLAIYRTDVETLGFDPGEAWISEGNEAVAMWLPHDAYDRLDRHRLDVLDRAARQAFEQRLEILQDVEAVVGRARPPADWHLATMGTLPQHRRRGFGSSVLAPRLAELDRTRSTAVLETSDPGNLEFYGRLGFTVVAELDALPHAAPITWIMHRTPAAES